MRSLTSTEKVGLGASILGLVVIAACFFLLRDIQNKSNAISDIQNELDQEQEREAEYLSMKSIIQETKADREKIDSFFIPSDGSVAFIELIEKIGRESNATTTVVSVGTDDKILVSNSVHTLVLEIEAGANWRNLYHFFSLLENLPYSVALDSVIIKKSKEKNGYWESTFTLRVLKLKK